jgi:hypothetical protein
VNQLLPKEPTAYQTTFKSIANTPVSLNLLFLVLYKLNRIDLARIGFVKAIMAEYLAIELI